MQTSDPQLSQATLALRPAVVATVLDDGAVLLDLDTKYFYALNASGWAIAQLFESGVTMQGAHEHARAWGAVEEAGVRGFVERLHNYGLLEPIAAGAPADASNVEPPRPWADPTVEQQAQPLQQVIVSAFDPSIPLAE